MLEAWEHDFVEQVRSLPPGPPWQIQHNLIRRGEFPQRECPLTAVACAKSGLSLAISETVMAAELIGLTDSQRRIVVLTADHHATGIWFSPALRDALLEAVGMENI
jgi:hypothetical protein